MIGKRIREQRTRLKMSQRQLAGTEMTRAFISLIESGRAVPSDKILQIIAQRLGKSVDFFRDQTAEAQVAPALMDGARALVRAGQHHSAISVLRQTLVNTADTRLVAEGHYLLGVCLHQVGEQDQALAEARLAVEGFSALPDPGGLARAHLLMGAAALAAEEFCAARQAYEAAAACTGHLKSMQDTHIDALTYLGSTLVRLGDLPRAVDAYRGAFRLSSLSSDQTRSGRISMGLGKALYQVGELEESLVWTQRSIDLLHHAGSGEKILALHNYAVILLAQGAHEEAFRLYLECLAAYRAQGQVEKQASVLEELGWYWLGRGDLAEARASCRNALALLDQQDNGVLRGRLYRLLGSITEKEGDTEQAYYLLRMSYDLLRRLHAATEAAASFEATERVKALRESREPGC